MSTHVHPGARDHRDDHRGHHMHDGHTDSASLNRTAFMATLHCLTGCAIGEILGMVIGTALGWSAPATIGLAVALAFAFGYALTMVPLRRSGLALTVALPLAFASDSLSIAVMEIVDNGVMLGVPGAMDAGLGSPLFWSALGVALVVAFGVAFPLNRSLIARGRGHAVVHAVHVSEGDVPPPVDRAARSFLLLGVAAVAVTLAVTVGGALLLEGGHGEERPAAPLHEQPGTAH